MLLEDAFSEAFLHRWPRWHDAGDPWSGHAVLGRRLRPFSIWHALLLTRAESPLASPAGISQVGPADLVRAVALCRLRYPSCEPRLRFSMRAFWKMLGGGFAREVAAFQTYLADFQSVPEYAVIQPRYTGEPRTPAPEILRLVRAVIGCTGCSRAKAWDCPMGEARWWFALWLQEHGADLDFTSAKVREEQKQLKRENPALHLALVRGAGLAAQRAGAAEAKGAS